MREYALSGFDSFHCIADKCPDTCCAGWDVVIDDDTAEKYRRMDTPLGRKICETMEIDEDGDRIFRAEHSRCPFLRGDGLCEIQKNCGEEYLSITCDRFPRIVQEYDDFTEYCLSVSCPEAARITLNADRLEAPMPQTEDAFLTALSMVRARMIEIMQDRTRTIGERLCRCLSYAEAVQEEMYDGTLNPETEIPDTGTVGTADVLGIFQFHGTLDLMTDAFRTLTQRVRETPQVDARMAENLSVYYLYRYVLQAVEDGDVLSKVLQMITALTFVCFADCDFSDAARLYSKEVEHSYENMDVLYEAFFENELFEPASFYSIWKS